MPPSLTMYSSSPTRSGDGVSGALRRSVQAMCVLVTSPVPSGRTAMQQRLLKSGRDVDEPVTEHRPRDVRESIGVADSPDFLARLGIVGRGAVRADADQLIAIADANHQRRRVRLVPGLTPRRLPADLAGGLVDGRHERAVAAVAADDQQVAVQHRRSAVAVLRVVGQADLPDDLAGRRERRRAVGAEVHVDAIAVDDRRRRGEGVLGIQRVGVPGAKDLGVHELPSGLDVERERAQRAAAVLHRRREPDATAGDDRRRPARAGHARLPRHVPRLAPFEGHAALGGMSLSGRTAELGPVLGAAARRRPGRATAAVRTFVGALESLSPDASRDSNPGLSDAASRMQRACRRISRTIEAAEDAEPSAFIFGVLTALRGLLFLALKHGEMKLGDACACSRPSRSDRRRRP